MYMYMCTYAWLHICLGTCGLSAAALLYPDVWRDHAEPNAGCTHTRHACTCICTHTHTHTHTHTPACRCVERSRRAKHWVHARTSIRVARRTRSETPWSRRGPPAGEQGGREAVQPDDMDDARWMYMHIHVHVYVHMHTCTHM